eukprot:jgi/Ulvmu1/4149/UM019_0128.1
MWRPGPWPGRKMLEPDLLACIWDVSNVKCTGLGAETGRLSTQYGRKRKADWHSEPHYEFVSEAPAKRPATSSPSKVSSFCDNLSKNAIQLYSVLGETNATVRKCLQSTDATLYCDGYANQAHTWKQHQLSTLVPSTARTGHTRTQYDKAFCCEWIDNRHIAVSTKCGHILRVDRQTRSYKEIALEGSRWVEPPIVTDEDLHIYRVNRGGIHCVRANPSKTMLACSGGHGEDNNVFVLDLLSDKWAAVHKGTGHRDWVFTLSWLSDSVFATGSRDHTIKLWSPNASQEYCMQPLVEYSNHQTKVRCCAFDRDTERFVSMDVSGKIFLWDPAGMGGKMSVMRRFQLDAEYREECTCMLLDRNMLVAGAREHVTIYDPRRPTPILSTPLGKISCDDNEDVLHAVAARSLSKQGPLLGIGLSTGGNVMFCDIRKFCSSSNRGTDLETAVARVPVGTSKAEAALHACCSPCPTLPEAVSVQAKQALLLPGVSKPGRTRDTDAFARRYNLRQRCNIKLPARFIGTGVDPDPIIVRPATAEVPPYSCNTLDLSGSVAPCGVVERPEGDLHFDDMVQSGLGVDNAVFSHNWSPDGRTMFTCGGPLAMGMRGCCLSFWD